MKKTSSLVWRFFDRLEENKRCVAVLCKLCETQYKYFGNTTNLRTHLVNKHPIQWGLLQNGSLDERTFRVYEDDESTNQTIATPRRRKYVNSYKNDNVRYSVSVDLNKKHNNGQSYEEGSMPVIEIQRVDVLENSETEIEQANNDEVETINMVQQVHESRGSDEEWLEEDWTAQLESYEPKRKRTKYRTIKKEVKSPTPAKRNFLYNRRPAIVQLAPQPHQSGCVTLDSPINKDEFSVFGDYIGNKLRKFKSYQTSVNVQQLITTILWQAEYGVYDNVESVKRIVLNTVKEMDTTQNVSCEESQMPHASQEIVIENKDQDPQNANEPDQVALEQQ